MRRIVFPWASGLRALRRDWASGELRLLALALLIAVAAVTSVSLLADRVGQALQGDAAQVLGGDLVIQSGQPLPDTFGQKARELGLDTALTLEFPSMVAHDDAIELASIKAVSSNYPLRGRVYLQATQANQAGNAVAASGAPPSGTVWLDPSLPGLLELSASDTIQVGDADMSVSGLVASEPDRSMQFLNIAPRVLMSMNDLERTALVRPGSRVTYRLLVAGDATALGRFNDWLRQHLDAGQRVSTLDDSRPEVQRALDRAHQFLTLVALLTVALAAVAVALAARRFYVRHQDGIAVMRCLGLGKRALAGLIATEFIALSLVASLAGVVVGYIVHTGLVAAVSAVLDLVLPASSWWPYIQGMLTGILLLFGFALPSLLALRDVPPVRVLRHNETALTSHRFTAVATGAAVFAVLVLGLSGDVVLGSILAISLIVACAVFALVARVLVVLVGRLRGSVSRWPYLRLALTGMSRRRTLTVVQLCSLSMGLTILLLLAITRTDLLQGWKNTVPDDAPNTFLINIQPEQRVALQDMLNQKGLDTIELAPIIRARLLAINHEPVSPDRVDTERARSMLTREFNLSYQHSLPDSNQITQGRWLRSDSAEASLEEGFAKTLGIGIGDTLTFEFAGERNDVDVVGLRKVKWDSFEVNFFALLSSQVLRDVPTSYITSLRFPDDAMALRKSLTTAFPNITVFDIGAILAQVQRVLDQVIIAIQLLFLFTVAAGFAVLAAAMLATRDERMYETALLRTLGATRSQVAGTLRLELVALGVLAGLLAAGSAQLVAWLLAKYVFEFSMSLSLWPWIAGVTVGCALSLAGGQLVLRDVINRPPLASLRASSGTS